MPVPVTVTAELVAALSTLRVTGVALDAANRLVSVGVKTAPTGWTPTARLEPVSSGLVAVPSEAGTTGAPTGAPSTVNCTDPSLVLPTTTVAVAGSFAVGNQLTRPDAWSPVKPCGAWKRRWLRA